MMIKRLRKLAILLLLTIGGASFAQSHDAALKMVKSLSLGNNLSSMSYQYSKFTHTHMGIALTVGMPMADEWLREGIATIAPKYQEQWDKNLAEVWQPLLTNDEFESLSTLGRQSPVALKFKSLENKAGEAMQVKSKKILTDLMAEVLTKNLNKATEVKAKQ
jgi:hypothetical protein